MRKLRIICLYLVALLVAIFLSGIDLTRLVQSDKDAFFAAIYKQDATLVEEMLQENPTLLHEHTPEGENVFIYAMKYSSENIFNLLSHVKEEIPWESVDPMTTRTLLDLAYTYSYRDVEGAEDVEVTKDASSLHDAIERMNFLKVKLMINEGVDPNLQDENGNTGLMKLLLKAQIEKPSESLSDLYTVLLLALLEADAFPEIPNDAHNTVWTILENPEKNTLLHENKAAWTQALLNFGHEQPE